jgi:hypothetical protein
MKMGEDREGEKEYREQEDRERIESRERTESQVLWLHF